MLIKVCGMRYPDNIAAVQSLGVDLIGLIFYPKSPRFVESVQVHAGIMPDSPSPVNGVASSEDGGHTPRLVGVFVNEMPQTVITHAVNYNLSFVQLHGDESAAYIRNLRATLVPELCPDIKFIKVLNIREADDVKRWREYEGVADMLLLDTKCKMRGGSGEKFDWSVLDAYDGSLPFLLSGGIGPDDVERVRRFNHPRCAGIDLNSRFEIEPALKDVERLRAFIKEIW